MRYTSTRNRKASSSFENAVCSGYAPDGGLYVPERYPSITPQLLQEWAALSYPDLAHCVLRQFVGTEELADDDLRSICHQALRGFDVDPDVAVPVVKVGNDLFVAELYHGPTFCFKDWGVRVLLGMLSHFALQRNRPVTLLVSTTGDTGPAAVHAVADLSRSNYLRLLVHYPHNQISDFQRRQLTTAKSKRVKVAAFEGGGDDMDRPLKRLLASKSSSALGGAGSTTWTGANSYNIGRPLAQLVHYVWTYLRVVEQEHRDGLGQSSSARSDAACFARRRIAFVVPTGAMGNVAGGYLAMQMGLPVERLVVAVNANDAAHRFLSTGFLELPTTPMISTLSEAMNVQLPYNLERVLYFASNRDADLIRQWMTQLESGSPLHLAHERDERGRLCWERLQRDFKSATASDQQVCRAIREAYRIHNYYLDPHTAVGWSAAEQLGLMETMPTGTEHQATPPPTEEQLAIPVALLATASPCKFERAYVAALGQDGWDEYTSSTFYPAGAQRVLEGDEVPPAFYAANPRATLEENQHEWEALARGLIRELEEEGD